MRWGFALMIVAVGCGVAAPGTAARAQDSIACDAFYKNPDGSWTATQSVFIHGTDLMSRVGGVFRPGVPVRGYDVAAALDKSCPHPATAPPPPPSAQPSGISLLKYADANGTLDLASLNCGHLVDAPATEAELLLAWSSGPSNAAATKRRLFNMARLRTAISNIVSYCKMHRELSLVRVIDNLLLKSSP